MFDSKISRYGNPMVQFFSILIHAHLIVATFLLHFSTRRIQSWNNWYVIETVYNQIIIIIFIILFILIFFRGRLHGGLRIASSQWQDVYTLSFFCFLKLFWIKTTERQIFFLFFFRIETCWRNCNHELGSHSRCSKLQNSTST